MQGHHKANVAVVGMGIVGSSIGMHLAGKGYKVTILDAEFAPASQATGRSWAWLNANRKEPEHYKELNLQGMEQWRQLGDNLREFPGTIYLSDQRDADVAYPSTVITAEELSDMEPGLAREAAALGARLYRQEGFGYAAEATRAFLHEAELAGAELRCSEPVSALQLEEGRVTGVTTSRGQYEADYVVLAAGRGIPPLASQAGVHVPLADKPVTLNVYTEPAPRMLRHILLSDALFLRQARDGTLLISVYKEDAAAALRLAPDDVKDPARLRAVGQQVMEAAARLVPALEGVAVAEVVFARYPYPADGHPILGWAQECSNLYVAVMHSGATLGPLVGRLVAADISGDASEAERGLLSKYRLDRQFLADRAYA